MAKGVLEGAKGVKKTWAEIKSDAKNSCGSPMFLGGMTGYFIYRGKCPKPDPHFVFDFKNI
jgi:hypothetical protein